MHPLQEREPDGELHLEDWAGLGEVAADLGHLEAGDALERGACPVDSLVDRASMVGADPVRLIDFRTVIGFSSGLTNSPRFTRSMLYRRRRACPFFPLIGTTAVGDPRPVGR